MNLSNEVNSSDNRLEILSVFVNQYDEPCAEVKYGARTLNLQMKSSYFRKFIRSYQYQDKSDAFPTEREIDEKIQLLESEAQFKGARVHLDVRVSGDESVIFVDAINTKYKISAGAWKSIDSPLNKFMYYPGMKELPAPQPGGNLDSFISRFNLANETDKILLKVNLVLSFVPNIPHAILAIHGSQGSGKTTLNKMMLRIVDPHAAEDLHITNQQDLIQAASHRWVVPLDNLSYIKEDLSDLLCKVVTGASFTKRRLYSDDDDIIKSFVRVIMFNGINLAATKPDLLDRCLIINLNRLNDEQRVDENTMWKEFEADKPKLLGCCFDLLAKAIEIYPTVKLDKMPRLADYARWGVAVAMAMGIEPAEYLYALSDNTARQTEESLESSVLGAAVSTYFRTCMPPLRNIPLHGTPTEVYKKLKAVAVDAGMDQFSFPKTPRQFTNALNIISATLEEHGYRIERRRGKERYISITPPARREGE